MQYLIDTNILIAYQSAQASQKMLDVVERALGDGAHISVVNRIEFLGWHGFTPAARLAAVALLDALAEHPLDSAVTNKTIELRSNLKMKLGDALIAATALTHGLGLMTRNVDDFKNCGLELLNPLD